jgi:ankyrin repeat protein
MASYKGYYPIVWLLLQKGADVHKINRGYINDLVAAAGAGHVEVVALLAEVSRS